MKSADYLLRGAQVYCAQRRRFEQLDIAVRGKYIAQTGSHLEVAAGQVIDCRGKYLLPGWIDIHMHIESSMTHPAEFARRVLPYGVTTVVADPHEIANVFGLEGIQAMMSQETELDIFYGIPSSVPSTSPQLETAGAEIGEAEVAALLKDERVLCLGEVMNFKALTAEEDNKTRRILRLCRENPRPVRIEGHCPRLNSEELRAFVAAGVDADHTHQSIESMREKIGLGMFIELQYKSLTRELLACVESEEMYEQIALVTDDTMPDRLMEGQLDRVLRRAVELGMPLEKALYCASFTPARRMGLTDRGSLEAGKLADILLVPELDSLKPEAVMKAGKFVGETRGDRAHELPGSACAFDSAPASRFTAFPAHFYHSVHCKAAVAEDFRPETGLTPGLRAWAEAQGYLWANVMAVQTDSTFTAWQQRKIPWQNGRLRWQEEGLSLLSIFERHGRHGGHAHALVANTLAAPGAIAGTWSHDCHNLTVLGNDESAMLRAQHLLLHEQGGMTVFAAGEAQPRAFVPLRIAGILSDEPLELLAAHVAQLRREIEALGYHNREVLMSFATLGLPVSPALKLSDLGLIDVRAQRLVPLFSATPLELT